MSEPRSASDSGVAVHAGAIDRPSGIAVVAAIAPFGAVTLAAMAARTDPAMRHPMMAATLFLWIVADTTMLALLARTRPDRPSPAAILGVLAGASLSVWIAAPAPLRDAMIASPAMLLATGAAILLHLGASAWRMRRVVASVPAGRERRIAALSQLLPPALVRLAAAEWSVLHMALFRWGGAADVPAGARAFAYHRHLTPICAALLILSGIEIAVYHLLVGHWSRTAAILMFVVSDVGLVYLVGLIKSFRFRPILMTAEGLHVRAGFLIDRPIPLGAIADIASVIDGAEVRAPTTLNAALLAWPNIVLRLDPPLPRRGLLRPRTPIAAVAFRLDEPEPFLRLLAWRLHRPL